MTLWHIPIETRRTARRPGLALMLMMNRLDYLPYPALPSRQDRATHGIVQEAQSALCRVSELYDEKREPET